MDSIKEMSDPNVVYTDIECDLCGESRAWLLNVYISVKNGTMKALCRNTISCQLSRKAREGTKNVLGNTA